MKATALCFNTPELDKRHEPSYGKKYPGAGWLKYLDQSVLVGADAVRLCPPNDVIVIQEELNPHGLDLIQHGADPRVLMCLESPIFASHFYDNIPKNFRHSLLFDGGTEPLYFPSFDNDDLCLSVPWSDRKFLCMVTSNKHYSMLPKTDSPSFQRAMKTQLHDYRYQAIKYFMSSDPTCESFDLYGRGWDNLLRARHKSYECSDKIATTRDYKFALCFENGAYPGYITEKIIDCLVAGVVPVYMGEPNVEKYIPKDLFIDARSFESFPDLERGLRDESWNHNHMIRRGREWLRDGDGQRYNNKVFAKRILEMCS